MDKKYKIDEKDKSILYILSQNCRLNPSTIGKILHLSREVVNYRIKKMIENKIILSFTINLKHYELGYKKYSIDLKFQDLAPSEEEKIIKEITKKIQIFWLYKTTGDWDWNIELYTKDSNDFASKIYSILEIIGNKIKDYNFYKELDYEYFGYRFLAPTRKMPSNANDKHAFYAEFSKPYKKLERSQRHKDLVNILAVNSRLNLSSISKILKTDPKTVKKYIKELIRAKVITNFVAFIDLNKLNELDYSWYNVYLRFKNTSVEKIRMLKEYLRGKTEVPWIVTTLGRYNVFFSLILKDQSELEHLMNELREKFKDLIMDYRITSILKEYYSEGKLP